MKRLVMLAVLCAFVFGMAATASAADIKATGAYTFEFIWSDMDFQDDAAAASKFDVYQRLRTKFEFIANENLKGVLYTEVGTSTWGRQMKDSTNITDASTAQNEGSVEIKAGYIDFNWPGTQQNIKVGHFGVALPSAVGGSIIQNDEAPALIVSGPITDNVSYLAGWVRADKAAASRNESSMDLWVGALPLTFDGVSVKPFFAIGGIGDQYTAGDIPLTGMKAHNATSTTEINSAWWAGVAFELTMFDPFVFKADVNYGRVDAEEDDADMSGWYAAASFAYTGWDFMKPELFFAYTSGEDGNGTSDLESERMPILSNDWALGSFFFGGDWGLSGSIDSENDGSGMGFWTVGVSLKDISFFEGMKHTVHVLYAQGTNDESILDAGYDATNRPQVQFGKTLLEDDSIFEIDLNTSYSIYDELTAYVELGWISADWDSKWEDAGINTDDTAYKVSMGLNYEF
ncbi:outer membrane homotrimeric porin [Salidesulfovibrio onnuriiensis]|uniref:outer membrane homotrimeric porin n=1 Tax=Salidesulfovibrio onnuriiensis TaxID=2583823 RepID=UPI0011CC0E0B|nr:outer membrane homotrimeric porin [Salidesulfovibrio onnuriiensis]